MTAGGGVLIALHDVIKRRAGRDRSFELVVPRLTIRQGRAVAFTGPSGSGKSTLIDLIAMTLRPDAAARFAFAAPGRAPPPGLPERPEPADDAADVADVMALWQAGKLDALGRLRARHFGYVLQTGGLLPFLSVRDNIALPQRLLGRVRPDIIEDLARRLGILDVLGDRPARLSVGQRQRAAIARALAHRPAIVLADEPTAALDPVNAGGVMELFLELIDRSGAALAIATHDAGLVAGVGLPVVAAELRRQGSTSQAVFAEPAYAASERWPAEAGNRP